MNECLWQIDFYDKHVYKEIMGWPNAIKARFTRTVQLMKKFGPDLGMPYTKALGDGLFEIRVKAHEGICRVFYCYAMDRQIMVVHALIKKTQKTPWHDLYLARKKQRALKY